MKLMNHHDVVGYPIVAEPSPGRSIEHVDSNAPLGLDDFMFDDLARHQFDESHHQTLQISPRKRYAPCLWLLGGLGISIYILYGFAPNLGDFKLTRSSFCTLKLAFLGVYPGSGPFQTRKIPPACLKGCLNFLRALHLCLSMKVTFK